MSKLMTGRFALGIAIGMGALLMSGCQGCREKEKTAEELRKEKEEKEQREKPNFETEAAVTYPGQYTDVIRRNRCKRGHWTTVDFRVKSNHFDARGEMTATPWTISSPVPIEQTTYHGVSSRPFSIPKGEEKRLETSLYVPRREQGSSVNLQFELSNGNTLLRETHGVPAMTAHQNHMVVLTNRADSYAYLNVIDSVTLPNTGETGTRVPPFYNVVRTRPADQPISLPRQSLNWTTIAYLFWDDLQADQLDGDQRQAMIDWLHFGGQLILSGPDCLDRLGGSFLAEYLPATFGGATNLGADDFAAINQKWSVPIAKTPQRRRTIKVSDQAPILGAKLQRHPDAQPVPGTGGLAIERQIGRGRIVVTAFSLADKPIIRWQSYRSFFNGCLLRKPPRRFKIGHSGSLAFFWIGDATSIFDPLQGSTQRYLSRDLVDADSAQSTVAGTPANPAITLQQITGVNYSSGDPYDIGYDPNVLGRNPYETQLVSSSDLRNLRDSWRYGGFNHDPQSGTCGWNDQSGISVAARETLKQAAGITPPSASFVLKMLAIYLAVLVPLNWLVFRLIGRVEWAWIAAPFIAIGGALMVARMASLDIGFVRSHSQVGCIEIYGGYPRAHVAQYSALYTSLSTGYDLELDNASAQSLPLGNSSRQWKDKSLTPVTMRRTIANRLEGLQVQSNTTGLLHTEMMLDLQGTLSLVNDEEDSLSIDNSTAVNLQQAAVVRRLGTGQLEAAWIGDLASDSSNGPLKFAAVEDLYQPWEQTEAVMPALSAQRYWDQAREPDDENQTVRVDDLRNRIPAIAGDWDQFLAAAARKLPQLAPEDLPETEIGFRMFESILEELQPSDQINAGRVFRAVVDHLELAKGETRLIALTNQQIGNNRFQPESTRNQQQSLVVAHLVRPPLPDAAADANAIEDFFGRSNLDQLAEELESEYTGDEFLDEDESEEDTDEDPEAEQDDQQ